MGEVAQVFERCKDLGLLLGKGGEAQPTLCSHSCPCLLPGLPVAVSVGRLWVARCSTGCRDLRGLFVYSLLLFCTMLCCTMLCCAGLHGNAFRIKPPMCWTKADVDFCIAVMDQALSEL